MDTRQQILTKLRTTLSRPDLRFPRPDVEPLSAAERMTVTEASGTLELLAQRFGQELEKLHGSFDIVSSVAEARLSLINRILLWMEEEEAQRKGAYVESGQERMILGWDVERLPIPELGPALSDNDLELVTPEELLSTESREAVRYIRYGLTSTEAAFASTGSMLMASSVAGTSRSASLMVYRHIALIPFSKLYPTIESWLTEQRESERLVDYFRNHAQLAMITGPSKSADIEGNLTLGVHGPKFVHAILFDDGED